MKWTEFHSECCDTAFFVKYSFEQHVSDIDHCPSCGADGPFKKGDVIEMKGLLVGKGNITDDR